VVVVPDAITHSNDLHSHLVESEPKVSRLATKMNEMKSLFANLTLMYVLAKNKSKQMQREVRKASAKFRVGIGQYFGIMSWPLISEMLDNSLLQINACKQLY